MNDPAYEIKKQLRDKLHLCFGLAYEIGHHHGSNPWRIQYGLRPLSTEKGWGEQADEAWRLIVPCLDFDNHPREPEIRRDNAGRDATGG